MSIFDSHRISFPKAYGTEVCTRHIHTHTTVFKSNIFIISVKSNAIENL